MKNINIPLEDERYGDLMFIQDYYSKRTGVKLSKSQTLKTLLFETANLIRNTGETYQNRDWTLEKQEIGMHKDYEKMQKKGESNEGK